MSLFSRRGVYSLEEQRGRVSKHSAAALAAIAAQRQLIVPAEFLEAPSGARALAALERALATDEFNDFVVLAFSVLGPRGDLGHVQAYLLQHEGAPQPTQPLFEGRVGEDLNAGGVQTIVEAGRLPSRAILASTFVEQGRAGLEFTFLDPEVRTVYENGAITRRTEYMSVPVDALYDPTRDALFIHGGRLPHVVRVTQLVSGALQGLSGGRPVNFSRPPVLSEPVLYAIIDGCGGTIPGGELRLYDPTMKPMRYGTADDKDIRLSETGQRIKTEGLARDVDAHVPHSALVTDGGPEREVHFRIDERWGVRLRDPLEPDGYLALFDRVRRWYVAGSWLQPLELLARQALEARNVAVSQVEITAHTRAVRDELEKTLGNLVPVGATLHQRQLLATLVANVLVRVIAAPKPKGAVRPVALGSSLTRFLNEHGQIANVTLDADRRSAIVRRVWRDLEAAKGDLLAFVERTRNAAL